MDHRPKTFTSTKPRRVALTLLTCVYAVLWIGGVIQGWRGAFAGLSWVAAVFLMLAGLIVLVGTCSRGERLSLGAVALLGFIAEAVGVHFDVPFGAYSYTDALGPRLLGVPLAMAFAWMTLAAYVKQTVAHLGFPWPMETLVGALWLTALDLLIDPLAANQLGFWRWEVSGAYYGVPLINFAGWLLISLLSFIILGKKFERSLPAQLTGISMILFFTLLAVGFSSYFVAFVGCSLLLAHGLTLRRKQQPRREAFTPSPLTRH
ncbi:MAG TPA: carotenoid biosynthesis protein [Pyrinomonadaceae bacterium]|nr:carotenoid biosynthesis protein [Pyrinomonadaceae bacterium]